MLLPLLTALTALAGTITDASDREISATPQTKLVVLGGGLTEAVFALGAGAQVVGVDSTSLYPERVQQLPRVGYFRQLSAEGLLSLGPELIVAPADAGPPEALDAARRAGVAVALLPEEPSLQGARTRLQLLGELLDRHDAATSAIARLDQELAKVEAPSQAPRVLFIYARGAGTLQVAGTQTASSEMIRLAGGTNAVEGYTGYKPLTAEGLIAARPDVILLTDRGLRSLGGAESLWATPGLSATPAGQARRLVTLDDLLLLGFGPRTGEAVASLAEALAR